jgi:hypothetical protein
MVVAAKNRGQAEKEVMVALVAAILISKMVAATMEGRWRRRRSWWHWWQQC